MRLPRIAGSAFALGALGLACALAVSACGSSSKSPSTTTSTAAAATTTTAAAGATGATGATGASSFAAYQSCLQSHGVTLPAGGGGGGFFRRGATGASGVSGASGPTGRGGFTRPTLTPAQQQAEAACASLRPSFGGGFGGGGGFLNSSNPANAKFEACLKQHGVTTGATGASGPSGASGFRSSPAFQTAFAACRSLLPAGSFGGGGAPGGGFGGGAASGGARREHLREVPGLPEGARRRYRSDAGEDTGRDRRLSEGAAERRRRHDDDDRVAMPALGDAGLSGARRSALAAVRVGQRHAAEEQRGGGAEAASDQEAARPRTVERIERADREQQQAVRDQEEPNHDQRPDRALCESASTAERDPMLDRMDFRRVRRWW